MIGKFGCIAFGMLFLICHHFAFKFVEPVLKKDQQVRVGNRAQLFGLSHLVHQALTHFGWVDTFAHALGQSELNETGHFVGPGLPDKTHDKAKAGLFAYLGEKPACNLSHRGQRFFRVHLFYYFLNFIHVSKLSPKLKSCSFVN